MPKGGTGMRKIVPLQALLLLPSICLLNSCASYVHNNAPSSPGAGAHEFLYVQTQSADPAVKPSTFGYSVSADGRLTPLSGYPLPGYIAGVFSGNFVFTAEPDGLHLDTYQIGSDGSLTKIHSVIDQATVQCTDQCWVGPDVTDRTGSSLYVHVATINSGEGIWSPETYSINKGTGELTYVAQGGADWSFFKGGCQLYDFSADDRYAYGNCTTYAPGWIEVGIRSPDGSLADVPNRKVVGPAPPPGMIYSGSPAGTDDQNHLAAVLTSWTDQGDTIDGSPSLLASYTINADGSLTSTNTSADMPAIPQLSAVGGLSPSGKLFAAGETSGIQMFNFNGADPMTPNGAVIPTDTPLRMKWDSANHLFVLTQSQKLYVFTVTETGMVQASGSPYSIPNAAYLYLASF